MGTDLTFDYDNVWDDNARAIVHHAASICRASEQGLKMDHNDEEVVLEAALIISCRRNNPPSFKAG